jgi:hypothetical protein
MNIEIRSVRSVAATTNLITTSYGTSWVANIDFATQLENTGVSLKLFGKNKPNTVLPTCEDGIVRPFVLSFFEVKKVFVAEISELVYGFGKFFSINICIQNDEEPTFIRVITSDNNNFNLKSGDNLVSFDE